MKSQSFTWTPLYREKIYFVNRGRQVKIRCWNVMKLIENHHNNYIISYVLFFRFCGGLVLDIKRKVPFFFSDFYDALHIQSLSAILFIYLGTVTNAITFGGLLGDATENMQVKIQLRTMRNCMSLRMWRALCAWVLIRISSALAGIIV